MTDKDLELLRRVIKIASLLEEIRGQFDWKLIFTIDGDSDLITKVNEIDLLVSDRIGRYFLYWSDEAKRIAIENRKQEIAE